MWKINNTLFNYVKSKNEPLCQDCDFYIWENESLRMKIQLHISFPAVALEGNKNSQASAEREIWSPIFILSKSNNRMGLWNEKKTEHQPIKYCY